MAGMSVGAQTAQLLPSISRQDALSALERGATLASANKRLARSLGKAYSLRRRAAGEGAWIAPDILPWVSWIAGLWSQAVRRRPEKPLLRLGADQELLLWERIVDDGAKHRLLAVEETAELAGQAWALLHQWRLDRAELRDSATADVAQFRLWAEAFEETCAREGWIDAARAEAMLPALLDWVEIPDVLLLAGFDELTPAQESLLTALRARGATVQSVERPAGRNREIVRCRLATPRDEIRAAARWARDLVDAGEPGPIGVVVPDLASRRAEVERVFREAFDPASLVAGGESVEGLFEVSAGTPLNRYALVRTALLGLRLRPDGADLPTLSAWLRSEYVAGGEAERPARALVDRRLREEGSPEVRLRRAFTPEERSLGAFGAIQQWATLWDRLPKLARPAQWADAFSELLGALGWPGEAPLAGGSPGARCVE